MIFFREGVANPPNLPNNALAIIKIIVVFILMLGIVKDISSIGAIFWGINIIKIVCHVSPVTTVTIHWCVGAAPIFNKRAKDKISLAAKDWFFITLRLIRMNTDAVACVRKYFSLASAWYFLSFFIIKGMNTKRLISKPNQAISHLSVEMIKIIDKVIVTQNKSLAGCRKIII